MYKEILNRIIKDELRYITTGWTRIIPGLNLIESHSVNVGNYNCSPADVYLELGNDLDKIFRLRCECKEIEESYVYRFSIQEAENNDYRINSQVSIQLGELIQSIHIYETYENIKIENLLNQDYFPNAILFEFTSGNYLLIWGQEGEDQCEPCQRITYLKNNEIEMYKNKWMKDWRKFVYISINE